MKNSIDTIRNQTSDIPACSAVLQPTAPPRAFLLCIALGLCQALQKLNVLCRREIWGTLQWNNIKFKVYCTTMYGFN